MTRTDAVWITGAGSANPLGHELPAITANLLAGKSCARRIERLDVADHPSQIAATIQTIPAPEQIEPAAFAGMNDLEQLAAHCSVKALAESGWWSKRTDLRIGLVLGLGGEWVWRWEEDGNRGGNRVRQPWQDRESTVRCIAQALQLNGPTLTVAAACASGNYALGVARRWIQKGLVDVCLAGACDRPITPLSLAAFGNLRALSRKNDQPESASRPFDTDRDGFVMGEGGAMFVLERASLARRRGAAVLAELAGFGASSDASHLVIPSTDPAPAAAAMRAALADARVNPSDVGYVNAHATSTPIGDKAEANVLHEVLGPAVATTPVSSTKSMTGHLVSAAAAFEALACIIALHTQTVPPTINLDRIDPDCPLCHVPNQSRPHSFRTAVSNSFGFGGSNTCLVLRLVA
jgi:3-oxoacyl-[acyl-carrier-protein] synthase II